MDRPSRGVYKVPDNFTVSRDGAARAVGTCGIEASPGTEVTAFKAELARAAQRTLRGTRLDSANTFFWPATAVASRLLLAHERSGREDGTGGAAGDSGKVGYVEVPHRVVQNAMQSLAR